MFVAGSMLIVLPFIAVRPRFVFICMLLGALIALAGAWLVERWLAVASAAVAAAVALAVAITVVRDKAYLKTYPVFATAPFRTIRAGNGFEYRLHIAAVKSGFGIGMDFDTELDGGVSTLRTRWREVFADRASAERALMQRVREQMSADGLHEE